MGMICFCYSGDFSRGKFWMFGLGLDNDSLFVRRLARFLGGGGGLFCYACGHDIVSWVNVARLSVRPVLIRPV